MYALAETARRPKSKAADRIDARLPTESKCIIEHAASLIGVTVSDFVISQAYQAAQAVLQQIVASPRPHTFHCHVLTDAADRKSVV